MGGKRAILNTELKDVRGKNSIRKGERANELNAFNFLLAFLTMLRRLLTSENQILETSEYAKNMQCCALIEIHK